MKPITNIASIQEATGESKRLPAGGYICKYTNVEDVSEKSYLYMARFPYHGSGAMTRSPSPLAWRPDFPGAPREAH